MTRLQNVFPEGERFFSKDQMLWALSASTLLWYFGNNTLKALIKLASEENCEIDNSLLAGGKNHRAEVHMSLCQLRSFQHGPGVIQSSWCPPTGVWGHNSPQSKGSSPQTLTASVSELEVWHTTVKDPLWRTWSAGRHPDARPDRHNYFELAERGNLEKNRVVGIAKQPQQRRRVSQSFWITTGFSRVHQKKSRRWWIQHRSVSSWLCDSRH